MEEKVKESAKILEEELKLFRRAKEEDLRKIMKEFVSIQKKSNEEMLDQWKSFSDKNSMLKLSLDTSK